MMEWEGNPDLAETVCCICDDGGNVIYCDGRCLRSFHLSNGATLCPTLGLSEAEVEHMDTFFCPNCTLNIHQCFACGQLGRSNGDAQEVFICKTDMCGHFYHASCVAKLILKVKDPTNDACIAMAESIRTRRLEFSCPRHTCRKCGGEEETEITELQFGVCRRCPRVWHRKCLPRSIVSPEIDEPQRAWDNLLSKKILVYCERHPIIAELGTPARNHVKFPRGLKQSSQEHVLKSKKAQSREQISALTKLFPGALKPSPRTNVVTSKVQSGEKASTLTKLTPLKKRDRASLESALMAGQKTVKLLKHVTGERLKPSLLITKKKPALCGILSKRLDTNALHRGDLMPKMNKSQPPAVFVIKRNADVRSSLGKQDVCNTKEDIEQGNKHKLICSAKVVSFPDAKQRVREMSFKSQEFAHHQRPQKSPFLEGNAATLDKEAKSMVSGIIERAKVSISLEDVMRKHVVPACYKRNTTNLDKKYAMAKIESIVKGMRKAKEILKSGGTVEDAKANCSADLLEFIQAYQKDLSIYLCPFLHGSRYTSFGRHFTIPEKLAEIVERLHWYVKEDDTVVDFCCGSNHFSLLMKEKLEQTGKSCDYKNFDLFQTNNDFNFTKGDWFDVKQDQLPDGNRLVMGLNPPFALANQFVRHALKFKPKLLVLIVPKETERPGQRHGPYDLIWEDNVLLSGKSFHLPGSVDVDDQTLEDWNKCAPFLYMWSRPDWALRHHEIALGKGHIGLCSKSSYAGSELHNTSLQIPSLSDFGLAEKVEKMAGEMMNLDQNKSHVLLDEPITGNVTLNERESGGNQDSIFLMADRDTDPIILNATLNKHEADRNQGDISLMSDRNRKPLECKNPDVGSAEVPLSAPQDQKNSNLAGKDDLSRERWFEGCDNLRSEKHDNARHSLDELLERANIVSDNGVNVCRQERKISDIVEELDVLADQNNQPKRNFKEHFPSVETVSGERETPMRQETLDVDVRKLPNNYHEQREVPERPSSSLVASEHRSVSAGNFSDSFVAKNTDGCNLAFGNCKQASEHPKNAQSNPVFLQANRPSKTLYCPQQGPVSVWKQDTQNMQINRGYGDTTFTMQKRYTQYDRPEAPRAMFGLQGWRNSSGRCGLPPQSLGLLRPRDGGVGSFPHNGLQPSHNGLQAPHNGLQPSHNGFQAPLNGLQPSHSGLQAPQSYSPRGWTGMARPGVTPAHSSGFGSFSPQYQAPSGLHDPSMLSSHNLMVGGHVVPLQSSMPGCPPSQRLPYRHAF